MSVKTLAIDGKPVSAGPGDTILELCREHGIPLPTLCHLDGISSVGACRLCLVEVKGSPKLHAACATLAEEGMEVTTSTERLRRYRRQILELLFAERNHVCSVCVVNGRCELQELAAAAGMESVRFPYRHPRISLDASHPRWTHDGARCVLCTRCVRVCDEIEGAHTWDVAGRGPTARVVTDLAGPWGRSGTCTQCGKCVQVCPTGALFEKGEPPGARRKPDLLAGLRAAREERRWRR